MAGGVATAVHYAIMSLLLGLGVNTVLASTVGFVGGAVTRFVLSWFHVFAPTLQLSKSIFRYFVLLALNMAANAILLASLLRTGVSLWMAQVVTTAVLIGFNYAASRVWVFR